MVLIRTVPNMSLGIKNCQRLRNRSSFFTYLSGKRFFSHYIRPDKLSYLSIPGKSPLLGLNIGQLLDQTVERFGDKEGVVLANPSTRLTFEQFKRDSDHLAAGLLSLGFRKGDRIGIWGPNSIEWYLTQMAVMKVGMILVNINPAYQGRELHYCINKVGIKCMVFAEAFKKQNYYEVLLSVLPEAENCDPGKTCSAQAPTLTHLISIGNTSYKGTYRFEEVKQLGTKRESVDQLEKAKPEVQFDEVCNIQFTSGTTGNPKGVMLTHHNIVNNSFLVGERIGLTSKDKLCLPVPLFHCYGNVAGVLATLHFGATCVMPGGPFDPKLAIEVVSKEKCTAIYGTPTMHIDMLNVPGFHKYDLSSLRFATTAGAVCPEELIKEMKVKYTVDAVVSFYGLTETSPVFFQSLPEDSDQLRATTVGYPHPHVEVKLVDPMGRIVPIGTEGEMCTRGYLTMQGYWEDPDKTDEVIKVRWFHTGDLFVMLESGHAKIVGRLKDMIIRGGENIYPKEIEEFLHTNPKVQEAHVFGVPDQRMGEEVAAWINIKEGQTLTQEELKSFCKGKIAHYKVPRYMHFTSEFPKTISGKVQKFKMRDEMVNTLGLKK